MKLLAWNEVLHEGDELPRAWFFFGLLIHSGKTKWGGIHCGIRIPLPFSRDQPDYYSDSVIRGPCQLLAYVVVWEHLGDYKFPLIRFKRVIYVPRETAQTVLTRQRSML